MKNSETQKAITPLDLNQAKSFSFQQFALFSNYNKLIILMLAMLVLSIIFFWYGIKTFTETRDHASFLTNIVYLSVVGFLLFLLFKNKPKTPAQTGTKHRSLFYPTLMMMILMGCHVEATLIHTTGHSVWLAVAIAGIATTLTLHTAVMTALFLSGYSALGVSLFYYNDPFFDFIRANAELPGFTVGMLIIAHYLYKYRHNEFNKYKTLANQNNALTAKAEKVIASEKRMRQIFRSAPAAYIISTLDGKLIDGNTMAEDLFGYRYTDLDNRNIYESKNIPDAQKQTISMIINETIKANQAGPFEIEHTNIQGKKCFLEAKSSIVRINHQDTILVIVRDITQRKEYEAALKQANDELETRVLERTSWLELANIKLKEKINAHDHILATLKQTEEQSRKLVDKMNDGLGVLNANGVLTYANQMLCNIIGYSHDKIIGSSIFDYVAPDNKQTLKKQLTRRKTGDRTPYEITWIKSNGKRISTFVSPEPLMDNNGIFEGSFAVITDITELKAAQQSIRNLTQELMRVQENERQRISRDLHDNVAQELASLKIGCETLFDGYPDIPRELERKVMGFTRVLKNSIMGVRDLAYNLRPPELDQLGLVATIGRYCEDVSEKYLIRVDFYSAGVAELALNADTEINLYRIVQEALYNVNKHAEATHVTIRLIASYPTIILRIEDDGRGFDVKKRLGQALGEKRMGVSSMDERVNLLGGQMKIVSRSLLGTKIFIEIPLTKNLLINPESTEDQPRGTYEDEYESIQ